MAFSSHIIKAVCFVVLLSAIAYQIQAQSSSNASSSSSENGGGPKSSSSGGKKGKKGASSSGNEQASFDYSVLHARAGPGDSDDNSTHFCVIDVLANSSRPFVSDHHLVVLSSNLSSLSLSFPGQGLSSAKELYPLQSVQRCGQSGGDGGQWRGLLRLQSQPRLFEQGAD